MRAPEPSFGHLLRLSDDTGLLEHATGPLPRRVHGYCVDDVARGLVVLCRQPDPSPDLVRLAERYLAFVVHAQEPDGRSHNRLSYGRRWLDEAATGDWWGRGLWALGTAVARPLEPWMAGEARRRFELGAARRSPSPRAMAFAALGAAEVAAAHPGDDTACHLLADAVAVVGRPTGDPGWPWPEPRLTYANALIPEALLAAGAALGDDGLVADGLDLLGWLFDLETGPGHLSPTPCHGWGPGEPRPGFDQQAIEAATLADACARAYALTGDGRWAEAVGTAADWFLGGNDCGISLHEPATGGGYDGLEPGGRNDNQGAESTLALVSTLQHARRLGGRR
ncbi:MAG TPA: hypothetical protein VFO65_03945 [Acidimicrobiales bacterium]|nr:hypothetical protein [Acidimicrobiales bacterium]